MADEYRTSFHKHLNSTLVNTEELEKRVAVCEEATGKAQRDVGAFGQELHEFATTTQSALGTLGANVADATSTASKASEDVGVLVSKLGLVPNTPLSALISVYWELEAAEPDQRVSDGIRKLMRKIPFAMPHHRSKAEQIQKLQTAKEWLPEVRQLRTDVFLDQLFASDQPN